MRISKARFREKILITCKMTFLHGLGQDSSISGSQHLKFARFFAEGHIS